LAAGNLFYFLENLAKFRVFEEIRHNGQRQDNFDGISRGFRRIDGDDVANLF
jgi:hypothetical protein